MLFFFFFLQQFLELSEDIFVSPIPDGVPQEMRSENSPPPPPLALPPPPGPNPPGQVDAPPPLGSFAPPPANDTEAPRAPADESGRRGKQREVPEGPTHPKAQVDILFGLTGLDLPDASLVLDINQVDPASAPYELTEMDAADPNAQEYLVEVCNTIADVHGIMSCVMKAFQGLFRLPLSTPKERKKGKKNPGKKEKREKKERERESTGQHSFLLRADYALEQKGEFPVERASFNETFKSFLANRDYDALRKGHVGIDTRHWPTWMRFAAPSEVGDSVTYSAVQREISNWKSVLSQIKRPRSIPEPRITSKEWTSVETRSAMLRGFHDSLILAVTASLLVSFVVSASTRMTVLILCALIAIITTVTGFIVGLLDWKVRLLSAPSSTRLLSSSLLLLICGSAKLWNQQEQN